MCVCVLRQETEEEGFPETRLSAFPSTALQLQPDECRHLLNCSSLSLDVVFFSHVRPTSFPKIKHYFGLYTFFPPISSPRCTFPRTACTHQSEICPISLYCLCQLCVTLIFSCVNSRIPSDQRNSQLLEAESQTLDKAP